MRLPETLLSHTLATYYHMPPCSSLVPRPCAFVLQATNAQGLGTRLTMLCVSSYFRQLIHMLYHTQKFICSSTPWFTKDRVEGGGGGGRGERGSMMQSCHSYLVCTWCAHSAAFAHTHTQIKGWSLLIIYAVAVSDECFAMNEEGYKNQSGEETGASTPTVYKG